MTTYSYSHKNKAKKRKRRIAIAGSIAGLLAFIVLAGFFTNWFGLGSDRILGFLGWKNTMDAGDNPDFNKEEEVQVDEVPEEKIDTRARSIYSGMPCENYNRRPVAVTVSSDQQARPSWGLSQADIVFEVPSTYYYGKHTKLLALFSCNAPSAVRSIRSGRIYSADLTMSMDGILAHWGFSPEGNAHISNHANQGLLNNLNALYLTTNAGFTRNWSGAYRQEDTGTGNVAQMYTYAQGQGWDLKSDFEGYSFLTEEEIDNYATRQGGRLSINFSSALDSVYYEYDASTNLYKRYWGGIIDSDGISGTQIQASNVIVMQTTIQSQADPHYVYVTTTGSGQATIYHNGKKIAATWKRGAKTDDKLFFYDSTGTEIRLVPGQTWVEVVEATNVVTWTGYGQ